MQNIIAKNQLYVANAYCLEKKRYIFLGHVLHFHRHDAYRQELHIKIN